MSCCTWKRGRVRPKLVRYVENGTWPISNSFRENAIRPFAIGRKGWRLADTVRWRTGQREPVLTR